jgi:hypothetical protein
MYELYVDIHDWDYQISSLSSHQSNVTVSLHQTSAIIG